MLWECELHLYVGEAEQAWQRFTIDERRLAKSSLTSIQLIRAWTLFSRARSAVASIPALDDLGRRERLRHARRAYRRLKREAMPWTSALTALAEAAITSACGDYPAAERALRRAGALADSAEMPLHAAAARHRLGLLLDGEAGAATLKDAEEAMRTRGVRVPGRYAQMLLPGEWVARKLSS
jgi:hypothetical protein